MVVDDLAKPPQKYRVILADPPWKYLTWSERGMDRSADKHYQTMTLDDIKALPVADACEKDAVLFLWATDPCLPQAFEVMKAWGFKYSTVGFVWVKLNKKSDSHFWGMGHWTRANPEYVLLGTRGKPKRASKGVHKIIEARVREHSRKPDEIYHAIERLVNGPGLEMFGRQEWPGWDTFGLEAGKFKPISTGSSVTLPRHP